jgi:hypothetical protein
MLYSTVCSSASCRDAIFVAPRFNAEWETGAKFNRGMNDIII